MTTDIRPRRDAVTRTSRAIRCLPYDAPDRRTSLADLRTALSIEFGADIADIDPASGYSYSRSAYEHVRSLWRRAFADVPDSWWLDQHYREARANWLKHRPDWDDDWLAPEAEPAAAPDPSLIPLFDLIPERTRT